jgi:hypothetical protein
MKSQTKDLEFENQMQAIAKLIGGDWQRGEMCIDYDNFPNVNCAGMTKKEYEVYEKFVRGPDRKGLGFEVYYWNDESGFDYWSKEGPNYIAVTALISDPLKVNIEELRCAFQEACNEAERFAEYFSKPWGNCA